MFWCQFEPRIQEEGLWKNNWISSPFRGAWKRGCLCLTSISGEITIKVNGKAFCSYVYELWLVYQFIGVPVTKGLVWHILWLMKNTSYIISSSQITFISQMRKFTPKWPSKSHALSPLTYVPKLFQHTKVTPPDHFKENSGTLRTSQAKSTRSSTLIMENGKLICPIWILSLFWKFMEFEAANIYGMR